MIRKSYTHHSSQKTTIQVFERGVLKNITFFQKPASFPYQPLLDGIAKSNPKEYLVLSEEPRL